MNLTAQLDHIDLQIISILSRDAKRPYAEIGKKLFVSGGTVHVRIKKLMELGVIKGSQITVDYSKLGYNIIAYIGIYLDKSQLYNKVAKSLQAIPEIIESHYTTGSYSLLAKIICRDTQHLKEMLVDKVQKIDGISRTETFLSLDEAINRPPEVYNGVE